MLENQKCKSRIRWSSQEQAFLKHLRENVRIESWKQIAKRLNQFNQEKRRTGKQCREKYMNFLRFGEECPKIIGWTSSQDESLFSRFIELGPKWSVISKQMKGRSQNCVKNRFHGLLRKALTRITKCEKELKLKYKKPIKIGTLIQILRPSNEKSIIQTTLNWLNENQRMLIQDLKSNIVAFLLSCERQSLKINALSIIQGIHKYHMVIKDAMIKAKCFRLNSKSQQQKKSNFLSQKQECSLNVEINFLNKECFTFSNDIQSLIDLNQGKSKEISSEIDKRNELNPCNLLDYLNQQCRQGQYHCKQFMY